MKLFSIVQWVSVWFFCGCFFVSVEGNASQRAECSREMRNIRKKWRISKGKAFFQLQTLIKHCKQAKYTKIAAMWASRLQRYDLAITLFSIALKRSSGAERRIIQEMLKDAKKDFRVHAQGLLRQDAPIVLRGKGFKAVRLGGSLRAIRVRQRIQNQACRRGAKFTQIRRSQTRNRRASKPLNTRILFDSNSARIKGENMALLRSLAAVLRSLLQKKGGCIMIIGHTDTIGSFEYNMQLSKRRAKSVVRFLERLGLNMRHLSSGGMGYLQSIASNRTKRGRARNRRVEFVFLH